MTGSGGLSSAQVQASRQQHGCNRLSESNENKLLSRFLSGFSDPIIRILLIALCINLLFMLRGAPWFETAGMPPQCFWLLSYPPCQNTAAMRRFAGCRQKPPT